jgi:hypothetical protein
LSLVNLNDDLRTLFELTRLDTLFDLDGRIERPHGSAERPASAPRGNAARPRPDDEARP